ncbi:hypothetical protein V5279_18840 [Bradyrhizobium sp. 26S5]|uniref:hypothetical protein n=1 Tax=Bradyrhizobium sp. 26S5 TaxID=3139729 RepID=UPI0030CA946F
MTSAEVHQNQLSFFGRIADDLTRRVLGPGDITVSIEGSVRQAIKKADGYFAFSDLVPSATEYRVRVAAPRYQHRTISRSLAVGSGAVELSLAGEDELYVSIEAVVPGQMQVTFGERVVTPSIDTGAPVIGEGDFVGALAEPLEGYHAKGAVLNKIDGLAPGQLLRIVRSQNLLVRPGPYYAFPAGTTVAAFKVVEAGPAKAPVGGAAIEIAEVEGTVARVVDVQGLRLAVFGPVGSSLATIALDADDMRTVTNDQGDAVLYFLGEKPPGAMKVAVSRAGYQDATLTINLLAGGRTFQNIQMTRQ